MIPSDHLLVSVVIPAFKRTEILRKAVCSVIDQDMDASRYELIVVDSSPDESNERMVLELAKGARCSVRFFKKKQEGPASSRNWGASVAQGQFIAFMDSDCWASPQWLSAGAAAFMSDELGIVQGRTLPDPSQKVGIFTWYVRIEKETFIYECANIFYRKIAFNEVNGFSQDYVEKHDYILGGEDLDLAWRVKRLNWKSTFSPDALVYHEVQPIPFTRWIWIDRNSLFPMLAKKFPEIRRFFFARYFLDIHQALVLLGVIGTIATLGSELGLLLWIPYIVDRSSEPTKSLKGPLRLLRAAVYLVRDLSTLFILARSSIVHRSLLL
jgi:glycosyltransferase involved in cell wall biosynthesis